MSQDLGEIDRSLSSDFSDRMFIRSRTVVSRNIAGETLIVPIRGKVGDLASIYSFNGTASLIWRLLEEPRTVAELSCAVECEYEVEPAQSQNDVEQFLEELLSVELIEASPTLARNHTSIGV